MCVKSFATRLSRSVLRSSNPIHGFKYLPCCTSVFVPNRQHSVSCRESCSNPAHNHHQRHNAEIIRKFSSHVDDVELTALLSNNKKWVADQKNIDPAYFEKVGGPQHPQYLYFGCADSRVPANEILGLGYASA